jgi:hypothetical protein
MGILSLLLGEAVSETVDDVSKGTARVVNGATSAVTQGLEGFVEGTKNLTWQMLAKVKQSKESYLDEARDRQVARKLGVERKPELTPEQRAQLLKLQEFKVKIREMITTLNADVEKLNASVFKCIFKQKINTKQIKVEALENLHKTTSLQELKEQAQVAMQNSRVIEGRRSRTKDLLLKIVGDAPALVVSASLK